MQQPGAADGPTAAAALAAAQTVRAGGGRVFTPPQQPASPSPRYVLHQKADDFVLISCCRFAVFSRFRMFLLLYCTASIPVTQVRPSL